MELTRLMRFLPTVQMLAEAFEEAGWECLRFIADPERKYRGILPYSGQSRLETHLIYLLRPGQEEQFPVDEYAYISSRYLPGRANHLCCPGKSGDLILQFLLELFCRFQDLEAQLNQLVFSDCNLDDLCSLGQRLTGNAVCIHDDWFIIIAMSEDMLQIMPPERISESDRGFVPRQILEDFKFDTEYDQTYAQQRCQLWNNSPGGSRCLYVNLWQEQRYLGRLLLFESDRAFRARDYLFAECLAQRALILLRQQKPGGSRQYRNLDDVVCAILESREPEPGDLRFLLDTLHWEKENQYLCVRLQSQQEETSEVLGHVLHSDLFRVFPGSYIMYLGQQQCLIVNLTREHQPLREIRYRLSPLCRDYCLYAGMSSPVNGILTLAQAARQADIALEQAFYRRDGQWVLPFADCALDYMLGSIQTELELWHLVSPVWQMLIEHDQEKGTQYFLTLRTYLLMERDIPRTAETMIIHRTTLIYRLKKLTALTGVNLDDDKQRLYLLLSLRLMEQHQLFSAPAAPR